MGNIRRPYMMLLAEPEPHISGFASSDKIAPLIDSCIYASANLRRWWLPDCTAGGEVSPPTQGPQTQWKPVATPTVPIKLHRLSDRPRRDAAFLCIRPQVREHR